jgi:hypothetical protein
MGALRLVENNEILEEISRFKNIEAQKPEPEKNSWLLLYSHTLILFSAKMAEIRLKTVEYPQFNFLHRFYFLNKVEIWPTFAEFWPKTVIKFKMCVFDRFLNEFRPFRRNTNLMCMENVLDAIIFLSV